MNRRWIVALFTVPVFYILSYAPVFGIIERFHLVPRGIFGVVDGAKVPIYRPADWLIDHTVLREPILAWTQLWGQRPYFELASAYRTAKDHPAEWIDIR